MRCSLRGTKTMRRAHCIACLPECKMRLAALSPLIYLKDVRCPADRTVARSRGCGGVPVRACAAFARPRLPDIPGCSTPGRCSASRSSERGELPLLRLVELWRGTSRRVPNISGERWLKDGSALHFTARARVSGELSISTPGTVWRSETKLLHAHAWRRNLQWRKRSAFSLRRSGPRSRVVRRECCAFIRPWRTAVGAARRGDARHAPAMR